MVGDDAKADALLGGPRGRRVCLEFALSLHGPALDGPDALAGALFWGAYERDEGSRTVVRYSRVSDGDDRGANSIPSAPPIEEIARIFEASPLPAPTGAVLEACLSDAVSSARYWQEPDGADVLAAEPELRQALLRVARVIASSVAAAWWTDAAARDDQWVATFEGTGDAPAVTARQALDSWRNATQRDESEWRRYPIAPGVSMGGPWWSIPPRRLLRTTRSMGERGPMGLRFVEDGLGWRAAEVRRVEVAHSAHVFEITSADDWSELCRQYPLEVTASRRHDWVRATGRSGAWVIPDWARVADEYDGVHLTVAGYLNSAGRAIPVDDDTASVLAGWDPDQTVWLRDGVAVQGADSESWTCDDAGTWHRA